MMPPVSRNLEPECVTVTSFPSASDELVISALFQYRPQIDVVDARVKIVYYRTRPHYRSPVNRVDFRWLAVTVVFVTKTTDSNHSMCTSS